MPLFSPDVIRGLAEHPTSPKVSLLIPVHPGSDRIREDSIRLKTLLGRAREDLLALGLRSPDADQLLKPAEALIADGPFWQSAGTGLAVYLAPDLARIHRLPLPVPEVVEVSDRFHLKPLLPLLDATERFYVLAPTEAEVRLLRCTRYEWERVAVPRDVAFRRVADRVEPGTRPRHRHGAGRGGSIPQGFGHEDRRANLLDEWFREIDGAVCEALTGEHAPLVFVGIEGYFPRYAACSGYGALAEQTVVVNAVPLGDSELAARAWQVAGPILAEQRLRDAARYTELMGTDKTSDDLFKVVRAALAGRVEALFVATDTQRWGTVGRERADVVLHEEEQPGDGDLLNEAALMALLSGARVHALRRGDLPGEGAADAIFRW